MKNEKPLEAQFFYLLEKTNKLVRRKAEQSLQSNGFDLTIDQWLTLKKIYDVTEISQVDLAHSLFKDKASITRILEILLRKKIIQKINGIDKRVQFVTLAPKGKVVFENSLKQITDVRKSAIAGLSNSELSLFQHVLEKINLNLD